jgi:uncharacterized protein DUF4397
METWMNSRRVLIVLVCMLSLALVSCSSKNSDSSGDAKIRVVNVIPDAAAISLQLDTDTALVSALGFQGLTQYLSTGRGSREFKVSANGGTTFAIDTTLTLGGSNYSYIVYGPVASAQGQLILESGITAPNSGTFNFRVINVAAGIGAVDVYLTAAGADLNATSPNLANVAAGASSGLVAVNTGSYELRVTAAGTKDVVYDTGVQAFTNNQATYEAVIYTKGSSKLPNVAVLNVDDAGTGQVNDNLLAEFKVLNASSVSSVLNVLVDGNIVLSNIPFAGISNYVTTSAGSHTFAVQATATPGANLLTLVATLASATDTSFAFSGPAGALVPLVLSDNNLPPPAGRARIRFVNVSPGLSPLDVYVNFSKQLSGLASNSGSSYIEVTADATIGTLYEFDFNIAGTTSVALKLPSVSIIAGHTYTIYVVGAPAAPQAVVAKDD